MPQVIPGVGLGAMGAGMAGIGGLASLYSARQASKPSQGEKDAIRIQNQGMQLGMDQAKNYYLPNAQKAQNIPLNYYTTMARGNVGQQMQASAPEVRNITDQYGAARQRLAQQPRGMGQNAALNVQSQYQQAAQIADTLSANRLNAMTNLGAMGSDMARVGFSGLGQGQAAASNLLSQYQDRRAAAGQAGAGASNFIFELFKLMQGRNTGSQTG